MFNDENKGNPYNQGSLSDPDHYPYPKGPAKKNWIIALLFLILAFIILFVAIYKPEVFDNIEPERVEVKPVDTTIPSRSDLRDTTIPKPAPRMVKKDKPAVQPTVIASTQSTEASNPVPRVAPIGFHLIAGVFLSEKNAGRCMDQLKAKGYSPEILFARAELNYVSIFSASTLPEAQTKASSIHDVAVWILKK